MLMVNSKIDGPTGRVDTLESTMQTALTPIEGRPATAAGPTPWRMGPGGLRFRSINATTQFGSAQEMDEELLGAWRREVGEGDTVVVLGDIAVPVLEGKRVELVAELPGWKVLVFGNHEQNGRGGVVTEPFDAAHLALAVAGDPPLVLTHMPLEEVPEGAVNLHGHVHQHRLPGRRINVSVEQLEYRPWPLTALRRLAGRLVRGEAVPGETVAEQLAHLGRRPRGRS